MKWLCFFERASGGNWLRFIEQITRQQGWVRFFFTRKIATGAKQGLRRAEQKPGPGEAIAIAEAFELQLGYAPVPDADFARDVQDGIDAHHETIEPPALALAGIPAGHRHFALDRINLHVPPRKAELYSNLEETAAYNEMASFFRTAPDGLASFCRIEVAAQMGSFILPPPQLKTPSPTSMVSADPSNPLDWSPQ